MMFDRMLQFSTNQELDTAAKTTASDKMIDRRLNGDDINHDLNIVAMAVDTAPSSPITTTVYHSDDGASFTSTGISQTSKGNTLFSAPMPQNLKRFVKLYYAVGTALSKKIKVLAGVIVGDAETEGMPKLQSFPPLEDVASTTKVKLT